MTTVERGKIALTSVKEVELGGKLAGKFPGNAYFPS